MMRNTSKNLFSLLLALFVIGIGCTSKKPEPEGYRVMSYDATTHHWTILRTGTFGGKYLRKRLTVVCSLVQMR